MAKTMTFTYDGKEYTLEFTRQTVIATENMGFNANDIDTKPVSSLTILLSQKEELNRNSYMLIYMEPAMVLRCIL